MSIEVCFTRKKNLIVNFFSQLHSLIEELSLIIQLEVDNQYFKTKKVMKGATQEIVEGFCEEMIAKEEKILTNIKCMLYEHIVGRSKQRTDGSPCGDKTEDNTKRDKLKQNKQKIKVFSEKDAKKQLCADERQKISDNSGLKSIQYQKGIQTPLINNSLSKDNKQMLSSCKSQQRNKQKVDYSNGLLFSNQQNATPHYQLSRDAYLTSLQLKTEKKEKAIQEDRNFPLRQKTHSEQKQKRNQSLQLTKPAANYKYETTEKVVQKQNPYREKNHFIKQFIANEIQQSSISAIYENNQLICEKIDQQIHDYALQILHKEKPKKRSPNRKKDYQSNGKSNKQSSYSILDISKNYIPLSHKYKLKDGN